MNNYYISNSNGNDAYTAQQAMNPATPWKTVFKINYIIMGFLPGDTLLFKCGESYPGILKVTKSITIKSYGRGEPPVLNVPELSSGVSVTISNITFKKI